MLQKLQCEDLEREYGRVINKQQYLRHETLHSTHTSTHARMHTHTDMHKIGGLKHLQILQFKFHSYSEAKPYNIHTL
jgi:hypothetical protein